MYAISNASRVYIALVLFLCSALFSSAALAATGDIAYWSTQERRFVFQSEVNRKVQNLLDQGVKKPSGSTLSTAPSAPTISKNPLGGLSQTTQNTLRNMGQPSSFTSTLNNSATSAKTALKSCVRSPACAGRALGAGAIIYEGINAWKDVYDLTLGDDGTIYGPQDFSAPEPSQTDTYVYPYSGTVTSTNEPLITTAPKRLGWDNCLSNIPDTTMVMCANEPSEFKAYVCRNKRNGLSLVGFLPDNTCQYYGTDEPVSNSQNAPVSLSQLDEYIDEGYSPEVSDAPIVLLSSEPETITLSTPASAELPATTTTNTSSGGQSTTSVTNKTINYNVTNNNTSNPSINSSLVETTTTYDNTGNVTDTTTSTTTANGVPSESPAPSAPIELDFELPAFCSWASIVCEWIGWTKEGIEGEEPDLINLISEFEPDENQYNSGIGSGSCPAPMSLNLGIINRTVEVSYQPFCDFLDMIRPLVIAGAWLLSAFMYVGVLRRG